MVDKPIIKRTLLYIEDNLDKKLSLDKIAKELNYSKFYLARTFKDNTGMTLYKYIQGRRLDEAARKLVETDQPIVQVAFGAGYGSQQAFTQAFRCVYACTPQEYRRAGRYIPVDNEPGGRTDIHLENAARLLVFAGSLVRDRSRSCMKMKYLRPSFVRTGGRAAA